VSPEAPTVTAGVLTPPNASVPPINPDGETRLATADEAAAFVSAAQAAPPSAAGHTLGRSAGPLTIGQNFGARYHIIRPLGVGGMGAVYQAWDQELEVAVAVKVIRPDVAADPYMAKELERRFKRELILARQVTHKNVVRIHDIGEIDGIKYITMPYVQGSNLASVLSREGRFPVPRALAIARQVVAGLVAAHEAGVVHRDLKPANIMIDAEDQALIMDFGIARSTSGGSGLAMTMAGAVIGTVEYMAPEQANGQAVDQRGDVYAFGLILRDMVLGGRHSGATTAVAELMSRMQQAPPPLRSVDANIPEGLDALVTRCIQPNPDDRYQTSASLLADLERVAVGGTATAIAGHTAIGAQAKTPSRSKTWILGGIAAALVVALSGVGIKIWLGRTATPPPPVVTPSGPLVSLAVLPFRNATGDPSLDSLGTSLSEVLATDLGEASHVRTIPSERVHQVLGDLRIDRNVNLSPSDLNRIADFATAQTIVWGQYVKFGDEIRIDATLQDLGQRKTTPLKATAANQAALLNAVQELAGSIQQTLAAGSGDVLNELKSSAWRPSTQSFEALRLYNEGLQLVRDGKHQDAVKRFEAAIQGDPNFALAHSGLARTYSDLGYAAQASQYSGRAVALSQSLPPQERYLIAASHYRIANDTSKAIETYEKLLGVSPNNPQLQFEVADLYERTGELEKAHDHYAKAVSLDPKYVAGLIAVGRVAIKRGDPQASLQPLNNGLSLAIQLKNEPARADALQAIGVAYKRTGQLSDALKQYEDSLEIKRRLGNKAGMAASLGEIAQIQETLGNPKDALKSYNEALALQREIGDTSRLATTLINLGGLLNESLGRPDEALPLLREALSSARDQQARSTEALAVNAIGTVYLSKGQYSDAQTNFERALEIREKNNVPRELADTLHNLGETLNKMGRYDQALARYLRALELRRKDGDKRTEAIESYSIGAIFDYQGRYGAAVKSKEAALKAFRDLNQRDFWFGEILSGYAASLALGGRLDEAAKSLEEAQSFARELKNPILAAQVVRYQADRLYYAGDPKGAAKLAEQAAHSAARASDRGQDLWAQASAAKAAATLQPTKANAATLARIGQQANSGGLTYLAVSCAIESAAVLLRAGDSQQARQDVERALARAESLGLRELVAKGEYVLATAMRLNNQPEARRHYTSALQALDNMKREDGNQALLERADLKAIYAECEQWSRGS
jgi:eukaryotic-like serine/threonine-protein kinase